MFAAKPSGEWMKQITHGIDTCARLSDDCVTGFNKVDNAHIDIRRCRPTRIYVLVEEAIERKVLRESDMAKKDDSITNVD